VLQDLLWSGLAEGNLGELSIDPVTSKTPILLKSLSLGAPLQIGNNGP
jgi:hypothetical protein